jgi:ABC-type transport system involved in multi-copper enzyme maturation permease subunit
MNLFLTLTLLFLRQLMRRKWLWSVIILFAVMMLINYIVQAELEKAVGAGLTYDVATRRAVSTLQSFEQQIRAYSVILILVVSGLVAPASRKDGTTQFVLTLSVSRYKLALSQFTALASFVLVSVLIVHAGHAMAALKLGAITLGEIAFSWVFLLIPLMVYSAVVFSYSLAYPAIVTYAVLWAIPSVLLPLVGAGIKEFGNHIPTVMVRFVDNLELFFPDIESLILWPRLSFGVVQKEPPFATWTWQIVHTLLAYSLWILVGSWFYRNFDFGSRTPAK